MIFQKKVQKSNYIRESVIVLNGLLGLTPREIDVLCAMIKIDIAWSPRTPSEAKNLLSTDNRRLIMKDANMHKSNFNKIINKLKSIGLLILASDDNYVINELLKPVINNKGKIEITFILDVADAVQ